MVEDGGLNLGRVCMSHNQMKSGRYIASIQVSMNFDTYPEDFESMTDAYEYAAKKAVEHFEKTPSWMVPAWNLWNNKKETNQTVSNTFRVDIAVYLECYSIYCTQTGHFPLCSIPL